MFFMRFGRLDLAWLVVYSALAFGSGEVSAKSGERGDTGFSENVPVMKNRSLRYFDVSVLVGVFLGTAVSCWFKPARRISDYVANRFRDAVVYGDNSAFSSEEREIYSNLSD